MKIGNRFLSAIAGVGLAMAVAQNCQAAVLFSDNFDADSPTSVLNFNGFINWTVDSGTVDYIRSGAFGINCAGGAGGCVDSDGSTSAAGRIVTRDTFVVPTGTSYTLSVDVSGNQRTSAEDLLIFGILFEPNPGGFFAASSSCTRAGSDPFAPCTLTSTFGSGLEFRVFIEGFGSDNIGAVFDNVLLTADIAQVPEPTTLVLFGVGLAGLGFRRRKRNRWKM